MPFFHSTKFFFKVHQRWGAYRVSHWLMAAKLATSERILRSLTSFIRGDGKQIRKLWLLGSVAWALFPTTWQTRHCCLPCNLFRQRSARLAKSCEIIWNQATWVKEGPADERVPSLRNLFLFDHRFGVIFFGTFIHLRSLVWMQCIWCIWDHRVSQC
jgi:hypothetical protein